MSDDGEISRGMIFPYPGFILPECNVEYPMEAVLDTPMTPHCPRYTHSVVSQTCNVVTRLRACSAVDVTLSLYHDDGGEVFPTRFVRQPLNVGGCPVPSRLNPPMISIDGFMVVVFNALEF